MRRNNVAYVSFDNFNGAYAGFIRAFFFRKSPDTYIGITFDRIT